ncbi:hypothetical protein M193_gp082 [Halorubrum tailed phage 7]|uniref:hypothetical protein n=1 Tax=Halorubrum tailed phage 7 TaxID=2847108 RepID=UPI0003348CBB|nr:hypothetical protein M193_gp082 [Halorubrum tailed phage 7]AGM10963.1 hypothetical protein HRTV7_92 [Halorubrum tailed phage 7]
MPKLLDKNDANLLVENDDGEIELVPLSPLNRLLFDHGLWGLLRRGDEILIFGECEEHPQVTVQPDDAAENYTIRIGDYDPLHLGVHLKTKLVDALIEVYEEADGDDPTPIIRLYDNVREGRVRRRVIDGLAEQPPFAGHVEVNGDGWLLNGHLLLTWSRKFYHPDTTSRRVVGSSVAPGSTEKAYQVRFGNAPSEMERELTVEGVRYRLTNAEMEFIARAMWGVTVTPV